MKPTEIYEALDHNLDADVPMYLWGAPGIGKSAIVKRLAKKRKLPLIDVRAVLIDPVDLRGIPTIVGERAKWCAPSFLPDSGEGILFLDELAQAPPSVQAALTQLVLDRRIGEYILPAGWRIIAASNRQEDRAGANRLLTQMASRFLHLDFEHDNEDWQAWALEAGIDADVRAFLRFKPNLLMNFDAKSGAREYACPRTWEFVSKVAPNANGNALALFSGCVGRGVAAEFIAFRTLSKSLPKIEAIQADPAGIAIPTEPSILYALCGMIVEAIRAPKAKLEWFVSFASRLPQEFAVLAFRDAAALAPKILCEKAAQAWLESHRGLLLAAAKR